MQERQGGFGMRMLALLSAVVLLANPGLSLAHHSTEVFYDRARTVEFFGVLQRLDMINPHVWFHFDETLRDGRVKRWRVEADHPNLLRRGLVEQFGGVLEFETGKTYTVRIEPAWTTHDADGYLKSVVFPNGTIFTCC
jgi:hypothetical protein